MIKINHINVIRKVDGKQKTLRVTEFHTNLSDPLELEEYRAALTKIYEFVYHTPVELQFRYVVVNDAGPKDNGDNKKDS